MKADRRWWNDGQYELEVRESETFTPWHDREVFTVEAEWLRKHVAAWGAFDVVEVYEIANVFYRVIGRWRGVARVNMLVHHAGVAALHDNHRANLAAYKASVLLGA